MFTIHISPTRTRKDKRKKKRTIRFITAIDDIEFSLELGERWNGNVLNSQSDQMCQYMYFVFNHLNK